MLRTMPNLSIYPTCSRRVQSTAKTKVTSFRLNITKWSNLSKAALAADFPSPDKR